MFDYYMLAYMYPNPSMCLYGLYIRLALPAQNDTMVYGMVEYFGENFNNFDGSDTRLLKCQSIQFGTIIHFIHLGTDQNRRMQKRAARTNQMNGNRKGIC